MRRWDQGTGVNIDGRLRYRRPFGCTFRKVYGVLSFKNNFSCHHIHYLSGSAAQLHIGNLITLQGSTGLGRSNVKRGSIVCEASGRADGCPPRRTIHYSRIVERRVCMYVLSRIKKGEGLPSSKIVYKLLTRRHPACRGIRHRRRSLNISRILGRA